MGVNRGSEGLVDDMGTDPRRGAVTPAVLTVPRDVRLREVDALLGRLEGQPSADLQMAYKLRRRGLLVTASLCQLVLTWAAGNAGRLRTYWQGDPAHRDVEIDRLVSGDHGLLAVLAAVDVTDVRGKQSLTRLTKAAAGARLDAMDAVRPLAAMERGGISLALVCDDRGGRGTPSSLYRPGDSGRVLRSEDEFIDLTKWIMRFRHEMRRRSGTGPVLPAEEFEDAVAGLLYELFRNTQDWATVQVDKERSDVSPPERIRRARLLRAEWHDGGAATLQAKDRAGAVAVPLVEVEPRLAEWLDALGPDATRVLELSILDAGPGLASHRLARLGVDPAAATADQQRDAVLWCLAKHATTGGQRERGQGLDRTLRLLTSLRGLLRIRTGRLDVYRDLATDPHVPSEPLHVRDWSTGSAVPDEHPPVVGTLVSVVLPIRGEM